VTNSIEYDYFNCYLVGSTNVRTIAALPINAAQFSELDKYLHFLLLSHMGTEIAVPPIPIYPPGAPRWSHSSHFILFTGSVRWYAMNHPCKEWMIPTKLVDVNDSITGKAWTYDQFLFRQKKASIKSSFLTYFPFSPFEGNATHNTKGPAG
jgi:hypothetical protein